MNDITLHNLGYPRIGPNRELKKAVESYWSGKITQDELHAVARELRIEDWNKQLAAGIDWIPCNDFSFYDQVLDMTCMLGNIPGRFEWSGGDVDLDLEFAIARGIQSGKGEDSEHDGNTHSTGAHASEMTKWFDTNYHYITPEFTEDTRFQISRNRALEAYQEATAHGIPAKPVLIGPVTYLSLGKVIAGEIKKSSLLKSLIPVYETLLEQLVEAGVEWVQLDEPILVTELEDWQKEGIELFYKRISARFPKLKVFLATYFGGLAENLDLACLLPVAALHVDVTRTLNPEEMGMIAWKLPEDRAFSLGVIDGRNIWVNDYDATLAVIKQVISLRTQSPLILAPSCSLLHVPVTLRNETQLDEEILTSLAFADEKLVELNELKRLLTDDAERDLLAKNQTQILKRKNSKKVHNPSVQERVRNLRPSDSERQSAFPIRKVKQSEKLGLPLFPTTTIGSFPQTQEIRKARAQWRKGLLSTDAYQEYLKAKTRECIRKQEEIGLDVLVHGEFERTDMVEYFGEQLEGFAFTSNGWVQSYGSRCVKPPVIFGDVSRPRPMTVEWAVYAQEQTALPMKGMLTGPVTILQWSFVRDDQPRSETARQIALALRDEVRDLEKAGIAIIQIDEPAIREGLPLRKPQWPEYLNWAIDVFRISSCGVSDETQIHTHMCYSEFNDIIESIAALDADAITIETSRSNMELLDAFVEFNYPADIGPGVYDIHSPRIPTAEEILNLLQKALRVIPAENLWVNPDCGLKTRKWEEVVPALTQMVQQARVLRESYSKSKLRICGYSDKHSLNR